MIRIAVDPSLCEVNAICAAMASDVFEIDDDGLVIRNELVTPDRRAALSEIVACCPVGALRWEEDA